MRIIISCFFGVCISYFCNAQTSDSTNYRITRAFSRGIGELKPKECTQIETLLSIVVIFDSMACVEDILLSETDECLSQHKSEFRTKMEYELNKLKLSRGELANGYILAVLYIIKVGEAKTTSRESGDLFLKMFNQIEVTKVSKKRLKLFLPLVEYVHKPIH